MACCGAILKAAEQITGCECTPQSFPFQCPRHKCPKTEAWHRLCKTRVGYFAHYESGDRAMCLSESIQPDSALVFGLGDAVAWLIRKATFGKVTPCTGCKSRMAWLNRRLTLWPIRWPWSRDAR